MMSKQRTLALMAETGYLIVPFPMTLQRVWSMLEQKWRPPQTLYKTKNAIDSPLFRLAFLTKDQGQMGAWSRYEAL